MNCSSLYTTEAIFCLIMALWFAKQLKFLALFKNINDPKGILLPTIVLFLGLIVIPYLLLVISYLYDIISKDTVILDILKSSSPIIAIATFFLGQYAKERSNRKNKEEQEKIAGEIILYLLQEFIELASRVGKYNTSKLAFK